MQSGPGIIAEFLAAERALSLFVPAEGFPEICERVVLTDELLAVLRHVL